MADLIRCPWAESDPLMRAYHDREWGVPVHDDRTLFEFLVLEGAQAGLSWSTILAKRERYREAFDGFDPERVARYGPGKTALLLADPGIVRNKAKVAAAIVKIANSPSVDGSGTVTSTLDAKSAIPKLACHSDRSTSVNGRGDSPRCQRRKSVPSTTSFQSLSPAMSGNSENKYALRRPAPLAVMTTRRPSMAGVPNSAALVGEGCSNV